MINDSSNYYEIAEFDKQVFLFVNEKSTHVNYVILVTFSCTMNLCHDVKH